MTQEPLPTGRFPARLRMQSARDFARVYARRQAVHCGWLTLAGCENELGWPRLGLSVSRKVGGAVTRNRWKRLLREAFRLEQADWPVGVDYVAIPRAAEPPPLEELRRELIGLAQRLHKRLSRQSAQSSGTANKPTQPPERT